MLLLLEPPSMTDSQPHVDTQVLLSPGGSGAGAQRARTHEGGNDSNALNADEKADAEGDGQSILPQFGRKLREEYWSFEEGWTNLNHGPAGFSRFLARGTELIDGGLQGHMELLQFQSSRPFTRFKIGVRRRLIGG